MMPLELGSIRKTKTNITQLAQLKNDDDNSENETREKRSQNDCEMGQIARDKMESLMKI